MTARQIMDAILLDSFGLFAAIAITLALVAGALLVAAPGRALRVADRLNRERSFAWLQRALDAPRRTEPFIYRHFRVVAPLLLAGTVYFFWCFATGRYSAAALATIYNGLLPDALLAALANTVTVVLLIGNGLGFALGLVMLIRPSYLKRTEALANRWVDTGGAAELLNRRDDRAEGYARRYPRRIGIIILLATVYIALVAVYSQR